MLGRTNQPVRRDDSDCLILGRELGEDQTSSLGFRMAPRSAGSGGVGNVVADDGEGHMLVIAPTGAGKGRNVIIPNLLNYAGPVIVIDPKGEAAKVTARHRCAMGHAVAIIDPFGACGGSTDALNPFDALDPAAASFAADCIAMARLITGGQISLVDRFWDQLAESLLAGCIAYLVEHGTPCDANPSGLRRFLCDTDLSYKVAVLLDTTLSTCEGLAVEEFKNFLGHEGDKVRTSVRSTAIQHLTLFADRQVESSVNRSSFALDDITTGAPVSIFLVIPPHKLDSYGALLRLWVGTLLSLITERASAPPMPTLLVLDELAQLGSFPALRPAVTLLRGYGVRCMLLLQDTHQLEAAFPADFRTIINNCASVVSFGHTSHRMSQDIAALLGDISADAIFAMPHDQLVVRQSGRASRRIARLDYLHDAAFVGTFDVNRMVARKPNAQRGL